MDKYLKFLRRKVRTRVALKKFNDSNRARLSVFKSGKHIYAQIVNVKNGEVVVSASSLDKTVKLKNNSNYSNKNSAVLVGKLLADRAVKKDLTTVMFDRSGYKYHGVIAALADEARKSLNF
ncbi:MAG: 50S ribosomal protein L18 [Rickettsia sp.]|nr:50S ribosomal protein L18 [Rickettsia sp.]